MKKNSKEAIIEAAISLFNTTGFHGTSIRDIASKAKINVANISYYFKNKHGLLEYCLTTYFEQYLKKIEEALPLLDESPVNCLKKVAENILAFQCKNIQFTRFILREMSIDSQIVREIMSTYYVKEKYFLKRILEKGIQTKVFRTQSIPYMMIQFKGLLTMPFLNTQYVTEVLHVFPHERFFEEKYLQELYRWIDGVVEESSFFQAKKAVSH
ncbi:MAG TPA: forespore capture DNA-binding protein RefZ [Pseudoneobacillus sp.]|nr:forespore capture DNA-binding protein RefZ [Pseudoneobacillus sp.]